MKKCLIITAHIENPQQLKLDFKNYDFIICADGGYILADKFNIKPDVLIGDYDSMEEPTFSNIIKLPMEKDMTDSEAALDLAVSKEFSHIDIIGGLGGRFDHTMGNVGLLAKYLGKLDHLAFIDGQNYVYMISAPGTTIIKQDYKYLGLISYGMQVDNLTLTGTKYPLTNHTLTNDTTLGVSNEIINSEAKIQFTSGKILVILSKDIDKI